MSRAHAEASAIIPAVPEKVYAVLRDYQNQHPRILPEQYFVDFKLEQGGQGAGTVFRGKTRVMGREIPFHMRVSEPQPGRLMETDLETGMETTFSLSPEGGETRLTIATDWQPASGLAGLLERWFTPGVMKKIYTAELEKIARYVRETG